MDRYAVIGNPIAHSLSPDIHTAFAQQTGHEIEYTRLFAEEHAFVEEAERFFDAGGRGLNVTAPFKGDAYNWVAQKNLLAEEAEAVNTIVPRSDGFHGCNTDGLGLLRDFERLNWSLEDARLLILGAGGATRGILGPLLRARAIVSVANRTVSKVTDLQEVHPSIKALPLDNIDSGWDIVINATSAARNAEKLPFDPAILLDTRCYDLAYSRDGTTAFLESARREGALVAADGLGMLVFQAAEAFNLWRGVMPEGEPVLDSLRTKKPVRRFIAGAICEQCGSVDTSFIEIDDSNEVVARGCVACNFYETADGERSVHIVDPKG